MLETFRKYTGLMFVVLILLFLGLVFFGSGGQSPLSGPTVVEANGRGYSQQEFTRLAASPARMLRELAGNPFQPQTRDRYQAVGPYLERMGMPWYFPLETEQLGNYLVSRNALHKAMKDFGVHASTAEVEQYLQENIFWTNGAFDFEAYNTFVERSLPPLGMSVKDMNEVVGEVIALNKLSEIVGGGIEVSREAVTAEYLTSQQRIDYQLITFPLTKYEIEINPTEEEIKKHWEENRGKFLSKAERRITYILAQPDYAKLEEEKRSAKEGAEGAEKKEDAADPDPEAEAEEPKPAEPKEETPKDAPLSTEEREAAVVDLGIALDNLWDRLQDSEGQDFEKLAKEAGFEVKTTELFTSETISPDLGGSLRDEPGKTGTDVIFAHDPGDNLWDATSDVRRMGSDQWLLFRVDESIEPQELTFETARDEARLELVKARATEAMTKDAEAKRTALDAALKEGKTFAEATAPLELKPIARTGVTRPARPGAAQTEFDLGAKTNPGNVSEAFTEDNAELGIKRAIIVYVDKREVYDDPSLETRIDVQVAQTRDRLRNLALDNWFAQQSADANVTFKKSGP